MEAIFRDYSPKGVQFRYIYKSLAHPERDGYVQPLTIEERLMHIKEAKRTLGTKVEWICDTMSNDLKHALGDAPNSEFIVGPNGHILRRRAWSDPKALRSDLEELVGPVKNPTRAADIKLKVAAPPKVAPSGVVPRIKVPGTMSALKIEAKASSTPYYAKLRAEADAELLRGRSGTLYVGLHLDPIHHAHWNNLAGPLRFEIKAPAGVKVTPASGRGPDVKEPADIDPREFLLSIRVDKRTSRPLELQVTYVACNDAEGWCKEVVQTYLIHLEADPDGGRNQERGGRRGGSRRGGGRRR